MRDLRVISGPVLGGYLEGRFWSILGQFWTHSGPYLRKPHQCTGFYLHLAVGRALRLEYTEYGVLGMVLGGYRYSPSQYPTHPIPRVHPSPTLPATCSSPAGPRDEGNMVVGLISVGQLTLRTRISGSRGITEGYNL